MINIKIEMAAQDRGWVIYNRNSEENLISLRHRDYNFVMGIFTDTEEYVFKYIDRYGYELKSKIYRNFMYEYDYEQAINYMDSIVDIADGVLILPSIEKRYKSRIIHRRII